MTARNTYWMVAEGSDYALVTGAAERDRMARDGWVETGEPGDTEFVTMWRAGIPEPGRTTMDALRALWGPRGWVAGPPPGSPNPLAPAEAEAESKPITPAAGGDTGEVSNG